MTTEPINMSRPHLPALRKNLSFGGGRPVAKLHSAGRYFLSPLLSPRLREPKCVEAIPWRAFAAAEFNSLCAGETAA